MLPATREAVLRLDDEEQPVLVERCARDVRVAEGAHEPEVDPLAHDEVEQLLRVPCPHADGHAGVPDGEPRQDGGEDVGAHGRRGAERELSRAPALERVHHPAAVGQRFDGADGVGEERISRLGEPHAARGSHEELRAEIALQPLNTRGQRGLSEEESVGCAADAAGARDFDERLKLAQKH